MIVLGTDTHKRSHTIAAVSAATGELLGEQMLSVGQRGFGALLQCARGLDDDRVWGLRIAGTCRGRWSGFDLAR